MLDGAKLIRISLGSSSLKLCRQKSVFNYNKHAQKRFSKVAPVSEMVSSLGLGAQHSHHYPAIKTQPLVDKFARVHTYLRLSLTEKCNLRCQYCMPEEGVELSKREHLLTENEIVYLAKLFITKFGINRIRLTGGEPILQPRLPQIIAALDQFREYGLTSIGMTSNGIGLKPKLKLLHDNGLDRLNISLDTLHEQKYSFITRRKGLKLVWQSINEAIRLQIFPLKLNCVLMKGLNEDEVIDFVELTRNNPVDVRFIEYMPFSGNKWHSDKLIPMAETLQTICNHFPNVSKLQNDKNDTARSYKVDGFCGSFGFISSMTNHFCGGCNRLRVTADGNLKVCLFDTNELSLRDLIRDGDRVGEECQEDVIGEAIKKAVRGKFFSHGGKQNDGSSNLSSGNRSMILIGG